MAGAGDELGGLVLADPTKTIGRSIRTTGLFDLAVSEVLARLIDPGDTVVDASANVGYMTVLAAAAAGPTGRVVAFEPHPDLFAVLRQNVEMTAGRLPSATVDLHNAALGEAAVTAQLVLPPDFSSNDGVGSLATVASAGSKAIPVSVTMLDEALGEARVGLMKMDVEGFELHVLHGGRQALDWDGSSTSCSRITMSSGARSCGCCSPPAIRCSRWVGGCAASSLRRSSAASSPPTTKPPASSRRCGQMLCTSDARDPVGKCSRRGSIERIDHISGVQVNRSRDATCRGAPDHPPPSHGERGVPAAHKSISRRIAANRGSACSERYCGKCRAHRMKDGSRSSQARRANAMACSRWPAASAETARCAGET